jgi:nucleotide-binding universal stress UspA family protein
MTNPRKLLIAVDGSPRSLEAVSYVALNLPPTDFRVNLMYVMPAAPEGLGDLEKEGFFKRTMRAKHTVWEKTGKEAAQVFLHEARSLLLKVNFREDDVRLILEKRQVGIARDIIAEGSRGYEAVVVGRKGLSRLKDIFLGSVSYKIVQGIKDVPVWVVGGDIRSKKMLLAVDGSENSRKAVDYAANLAAANESGVTLFNVVREFRLDFLDNSTPRGEEIEMRILEKLERDVQHMFASYRIGSNLSGLESTQAGFRSSVHCRAEAAQGTFSRKQRKGTTAPSLWDGGGFPKCTSFFWVE